MSSNYRKHLRFLVGVISLIQTKYQGFRLVEKGKPWSIEEDDPPWEELEIHIRGTWSCWVRHSWVKPRSMKMKVKELWYQAKINTLKNLMKKTQLSQLAFHFYLYTVTKESNNLESRRFHISYKTNYSFLID